MDFILAKYYIQTKGNLKDVAEKIAREETTGGWVGEASPTDLFKGCTAQVYSLEEIGKGEGVVTIAFPTQNMNLEDIGYSNIWLFLTGGPVFELPIYERARLLDFELPEELLTRFPGPKFGMKGTRKLLGRPDDELLIGTIVKPCCGLTPEEVAEKCYQVAQAGIDFIKDDEKMNNPEYCPLRKRVRLVSEAIRRANEETGRKTLYAPHITVRSDKILDLAKEAIDAGATALMLNFFAAGFTALQVLAEDPSINVPIYVHTGGRSAWGRAEGQGIDLKVIAKLVRILGGDYMRVHMLGTYLLAGTKEESLDLVSILRKEMANIKDTVSVLSGGLHAGNLGANIKAYGINILPLAGASILAHPQGIKAGVTALRQANEAYLKGIPLEEYANFHQELRVEIEKRGVFKD